MFYYFVLKSHASKDGKTKSISAYNSYQVHNFFHDNAKTYDANKLTEFFADNVSACETQDFIAYRVEENEIMRDKKENVHYWDEIDNQVAAFVEKMAKMSVTPLAIGNTTLESIAYADGIIPEIRDRLVEVLKEYGGYFPYVEGDF